MMKKTVFLVMLVPALLAAAAPDVVAGPSPYRARGAGPGPAVTGAPPAFTAGRVDTVGGSVYDWMTNAQMNRWVAVSEGYGVHIVWMWSDDTVGANNPDRNMRYNFYDFNTRQWSWTDPDYMVSGQNTFGPRSGFGNVDADPNTGVAVVSSHEAGSGGTYHIEVARDIAPGQGVFEYAEGDTSAMRGYVWPALAVGQDSTISVGMVDDALSGSTCALYYCRIHHWPVAESVVPMPTAPYFPTQEVVASKVSTRVCFSYVVSQTSVWPDTGLYRLSTDAGATWGAEQMFPFPPAYSGSPDTTVTYYITSLNPFYDMNDHLHMVVDVMPIVRDTVWSAPIEQWHWCAENNPQWGRFNRADADPYATNWDVGSNNLLACRPQLGEDHSGNLYVVWEQFDTANVEPRTSLCRASIYGAKSTDNGVTWTPPRMVAGGGTNSLRFPTISDQALDGSPGPDTVVVLYEIDQCAGPRAGTSPIGPWTNNAMVAQFIPVDWFDGVAEPKPGPAAVKFALAAAPDPVSGRARISYAVPAAGSVSLVVRDAAGRTVITLASGRKDAGRHAATWDAGSCPAGIYFVTFASGGNQATRKLVVTR